MRGCESAVSFFNGRSWGLHWLVRNAGQVCTLLCSCLACMQHYEIFCRQRSCAPGPCHERHCSTVSCSFEHVATMGYNTLNKKECGESAVGFFHTILLSPRFRSDMRTLSSIITANDNESWSNVVKTTHVETINQFGTHVFSITYMWSPLH